MKAVKAIYEKGKSKLAADPKGASFTDYKKIRTSVI